MIEKFGATTDIFLETRWRNKTGTYPVKLRVTFERERKYYRINKFSLSKDDFKKIKYGNPRGKLKELKMIFSEYERKAIEAISKIEYFTFEKFEEIFLSHNRKGKDVFSYFENYISVLKEQKRFGTADSYLTSYKSISKYYKKKKLLFEDITPKFLNRYEEEMLNNGKSITTIGIYLRNLRKLFNDYIEDANAPRNIYPFGRNKYIIPKGRNIKKALKLEDIEKLYYYKAEENSETQFAKDIFLFSYFCNGMNMTDVFRLKFKDIKGDRIYFQRTKTKRTSKGDSKPVTVILTDEIKEILKRWQNTNDEPNNYIFPLLNDISDPEQQRLRVKYKTKTINTHLKKIFKDLGFDIQGSTIYARHSFATIMRNSGASDEFISESIGHQNTQVTRHYLDSFEDDIKKEFANKLIAFKKRQKIK